MRKPTIIKHIKRIIEEWGAFGSGEVEGSLGETYSPCVNSMGGLVALAEYFNLNEVEVNVYDPESFSSDAMHTYTVSYEDLSKDALEEILDLCDQYDVNNFKTKQRCEN
jgi:hypothetical protein